MVSNNDGNDVDFKNQMPRPRVVWEHLREKVIALNLSSK